MKELRFRAWDDFLNDWHATAATTELMDKCNKGYNFNIVCFGNPERVHIEQYTGLKDRNGKEIYEGDILEFDKDFDDTPQRYVPYFDEKLAAFGFKIYGYQDYISESGAEEFESEISLIGKTDNYEREEIIFYTEYISIVGNIHENADLLGEK